MKYSDSDQRGGLRGREMNESFVIYFSKAPLL